MFKAHLNSTHYQINAEVFTITSIANNFFKSMKFSLKLYFLSLFVLTESRSDKPLAIAILLMVI